MASDLGVRRACAGSGQPFATAQERVRLPGAAGRKTPGFPRALWVVMLTSGEFAYLVLTQAWTGCSYSGKLHWDFYPVVKLFPQKPVQVVTSPTSALQPEEPTCARGVPWSTAV